MNRRELLAALLEILATGPGAAQVVVVVSLPGEGEALVGAFGEVASGAEVTRQLVRVAGMVERNGGMIDSFEALRATIRGREQAEELSEPPLPD